MKIAIVEDEKIHQDYLIKMLEVACEQEGLQLSIHVFDTAEKFMIASESNSFEAILLDIRLDEMNGFSLAEVIREKDHQVPIAFITGETDYVYRGYDVNACAYILKPIKQASINDLVIKLREKIKQRALPLMIKTKDGIRNFYQNELLVVESDDHQTRLTTKENTFICLMKMKEWLDLLDEHVFFQPHRTCLINISKIELIEKKQVVMSNKVILPIARGKWEALMRSYMNYRRQVY